MSTLVIYVDRKGVADFRVVQRLRVGPTKAMWEDGTLVNLERESVSYCLQNPRYHYQQLQIGSDNG
jgi:hypothetical protein